MDTSTIRHVLARPSIIPERHTLHGSVTSLKLKKTMWAYLAILVLCLVPLVTDLGIELKTFSLGIILPGGGLLYLGKFAALAVIVLALFISFFLWFATGNIVLPFLVWIGSAAFSVVMTWHHLFHSLPGDWFDGMMSSSDDMWQPAEFVVPAIALLLVTTAVVSQRRTQNGAERIRVQRNNYLKDITEVSVEDRYTPEAVVQRELSADEAALSRYMYDRALQPLDQYEGFDKIEQFQTASIRYQLCELSYSLSVLQHNYLPSFRGYLAQAQRNIFEKMQQPINWGYWKWENLWGNFDTNPDPIPNDNIMYSGWYAAALGMYMSNNNDFRYTEKGSIELRRNDKEVYLYDFHSIVGHLVNNFQRSEYCLFPCEPNWIYAMCNNYGVLSLLLSDRLFGTTYFDEIGPAYRKSLEEEFITLDGRITAIRSSRFGFSLPGLTSTMADAMTSYYLHPVFPDIAHRSWEIVNQEFVDDSGDDVDVQLRGWDKIDTGNYKFSNITTVGQVAAAAKEMGSEALGNKILVTLREDERYGCGIREGVMSFSNASNYANVMLNRAHFSVPLGFHNMIRVGAERNAHENPYLLDAEYPKVLVAAAHPDGDGLHLVLHAGTADKIQSICIGNLQPGRSNTVQGGIRDSLVGDSKGEATLELNLESRTVVKVMPA